MQWYPFDQQTCSIQMIMDGVLDSYADLRPRDLLFSGPQELSQYYVKHFLMEKAVINSRPAVVVSVTLGRRLLGLNKNYQITIFFNNSDLDRNISNRFLPNYSAQHYWFYYQLLQGLFLWGREHPLIVVVIDAFMLCLSSWVNLCCNELLFLLSFAVDLLFFVICH